MFNSRNANNNSSSLVANHINDNTNINGDIQANSDMRIDGNVKGNIICSSKVVVGRTSRIEGNIKCSDLTVEGTVIGDIIAEENLHFKSSANFEGNIKYNTLIVENGANILGSLLQNRSKITSNQDASQKQEQS